MTSPVPGWYADPAGGGDERWWDGSRWTGNVRPHAVPAPAVPTSGYGPGATSGYGPGATASGYGPGAPTGYGAGAPHGSGGAYAPGSGAPGTGFGGYGQPQRSAPPTFVQRNGYSLAAIGVGVLYALIALEFRFVLIGFLPLLFGVRALRRREPLGVVGLVVGVLVLVFAIYAFGHGL